MSKYKGLFTFDVENHRYLPVEQADGLITEMDYHPEQEPLIKDEKIRKAVRAWADNLRESMCDGEITFYVDNPYCTFQADVWKNYNNRTIAEIDLVFDHNELDNGELDNGKIYTIAELCGEEEE